MAVYATTDLHGRLDLYKKMKTILKPEDKVYFLGDAGDRGIDGWELIKTIYEDPQFVYIKGNHEDMLVDAARAYLRNPARESEAYRLLKRNGGEKTMNDWWLDGASEIWIDKLDDLQLFVEYKNQCGTTILMSHAGYTPWMDLEEPTGHVIPDEFDLLWNRDHFYDEEYEEWMPNTIVLHGHT